MKVSAPLIKLILRQELELDPKELSAQVTHLRAPIEEERRKDASIEAKGTGRARSGGVETCIEDYSGKGCLELGYSNAAV